MTRRGRPPHPDVFTPAEWSVLDGVRSGLTNAEIAERLGISVNTVRYHVSNMLTKVGVTDRQALAAWEGAPVSGVRFTRGGLIALTRFLGLAAALVVAAALAWLALDRLAGVASEVPAGMPEASATPSEVTPTATVDPLARDAPFASSGGLWARAVIGNGSTGLSSPNLAVRPDGTILLVANMGTYETPIVEVGGAPLPAEGRGDMVLAALTRDGTHLWSRLIGGPGDDYAVDIALTEDGGFVLSGTFEEGMDFGTGPVSSEGTHPPGSSGARDAFIARFDSTGDLEWVRTFGWGDRDDGGTVAILPDGDIVTTLSSSASELQIGTVQLETSADELNVVIRLSPQGEVVWARAVSDTTGLGSLSVDQEGDLVMTTRARTLIEGDRVSGVDGLLKLSSDGEQIWRTTFDGVAGGAVVAVLGPGGSIVMGGAFFRGPVDLGGGVLGTDGNHDGLLARFSREGDFEWAIPREEGVEALAVDEFGDIWLAGGSARRVDDAYVERLDAAGNSEAYLQLGVDRSQPQWGPELNQQTGGHRIDRLDTLIVNGPGLEDGEILIGGRFWDRAVFPFGAVRSSYWLPHFIARIEAP